MRKFWAYSSLMDIPEHLQQLADHVLGAETARRWWVEPAFGLGGQRPIDVLATPDGIQAVETLLLRIDGAVYT